MAVQVVHSGGGPVSVNVTTTPAISVTSPQVNVVDVNPVYTSGQPGNTGPQGPQGPAGANGADGATVTYTLSAQDGANTDEEKVRITGSNGTSSEVVLEAGTNLSIARSSDKITFASTVTDAVLESDTSTSGFGFVVDDDAMNNASDTKVPTQQSVKAYVDNNVTTANVTTNLSTSYQTDRVTIVSSDGTDAVILEATGSQAGVMTVAMHDKLDGIASNADATTSSNVNAAGAIMHSDVTGSVAGVITRTGSEAYATVPAVTVTDAGGDGSLAINSTTNVITYTGPSAAETRAHFSNGQGVTITSGSVAVSGNTTLSVADNGSDVELKVTGPSGVQSGAITFDAGNNITLTETGNNTISIASTASGGGATELNALSDVTVSSESANQYLVHNGSGAFVNQALDISHDGTPVLGGHLDVGSNEIRSTTSNGNIIIQPNGTGNVKLGTLEFDADQSLGAGQDNHVLTYDNSSGLISLEAASTASGTVDTNGTPANNQVAVFTDADTIEGQSTFTFDSTSNTLNVSVLECQNIKATDDTTELSAIGKTGFGAILAESFGPSATGLGAGKVCVLSTTWAAANAGATGTSITMLGVTTNADSGNMCLQGPVRMSTNAGFSGAAAGSVLYLATSAGRLTTTAPSSSGQVVRVCGYVLDASSSIVYFNPSNDWIELT